ncbi:MAG: UPF0182 family protein [Clostridia bacterium]|nr:UPF0182 family protein [Clostridia bacterium]
MKKRLWLILTAVILLMVTVTLSGYYTEYLEIREIGEEYTTVFFKDIFARVEIFLLMLAFIFLVASVNLLVVRRNAVRVDGSVSFLLKRKFIFLESAVVALLGAVAFSEALCRKFLMFSNAVDSGIKDPVFNLDLSYYFFNRSFLQSFSSVVISILGLGLIVNALLYFLILARGEKSNVRGTLMDSGVFMHLAVNVIGLCVVYGFTYYFKAQGILLDQTHTYAGAGYTDVKVIMPFYTIAPYVLFVLAAVAAVFLFRKKFVATVVTVVIFPVLLLGVNIAGEVVDALHVKPNETTLEAPFIKHNIDYTRIGFKLDNVTERTFPAEENLTREILREKSDIVNNIRITDPQATGEVLNSTKSIRNYYVFNDSDIVEYAVNGKNTAVNISVREIDTTKLDSNANNYINRTFKYTHGYGIAMNPVNAVNSEGQPDFIIEDMPIVSKKGAPSVTEPRIYYGEKTDNYCIVNTEIDEFDYALNNENVENNYTGDKSGIEMNPFNRLLFSLKNGDYTMLVSGYVNGDSRLLTNRNILKRVKKAVPFMTLDPDPYILIDKDGRLKWIVDLYTYTDQMPYSKNYSNFNYIRNSAKAVVDAYLGTVDVYITDESDPIVMTYNEIYPSVMKLGGLPEDLNEHIRYPEFLFNVQSEMYLRYHMNDPEMFYSNSDLWMRAKEKYRGEGAIDVAPYYNLLSVEDFGREGAQLVLMMPFVPANKENLVGWLASDSYGNLICYKFPSGRTVYGTLHIENRIDADADISKELSLWDQGGSTVLRGNVLVIPIGESIIYVEPVYITTNNQAAVPEVKRIIVSYGDKVVMRETLDECFDALFGKEGNDNTVEEDVPSDTELDIALGDAKSAIDAYDRMQSALKVGNWSEFGKAMDELGTAIDNLR